MHELSGRFLGRGQLRLVARLGAGAMGVVYEAEQPSLQRRVAVKVLWPHLTQEPGLVERFNREARIAARLDHPHVLPVYGFGDEDGLLYLVIRLVRGGSLKDRLRAEGRRRAGWTGMEVLDLARQALPALDYAHRRGVIHRDLKPDNILLEPSDDFTAGYRAFLSDFGIAQLAQAEDTELALTVTGAPPGTPAYMAPEQVLDQPLDGRADLYAFGVVLFELLAGRLPFQGQTPLATALQHVQRPLPSARGFNPRLSPGVEAVLHRALAKEPDERFPNGTALLAAFAAAVEAPGSGRLPVTRPWAAPPSAVEEVSERAAAEPRSADQAGPSRAAQQGPTAPPEHPDSPLSVSPEPAREREPQGTPGGVAQPRPGQPEAAPVASAGQPQSPTASSPRPPRSQPELDEIAVGQPDGSQELPSIPTPVLPGDSRPGLDTAGSAPALPTPGNRGAARVARAERSRGTTARFTLLVLVGLALLGGVLGVRLATRSVSGALEPLLGLVSRPTPAPAAPTPAADTPVPTAPPDPHPWVLTPADLGPTWQLSQESTAGSSASVAEYEADYVNSDPGPAQTLGISLFSTTTDAAADAGLAQLRQAAEARGASFAPFAGASDGQPWLRGQITLTDGSGRVSVIHLFRVHAVVAALEAVGPADQASAITDVADHDASLLHDRLQANAPAS